MTAKLPWVWRTPPEFCGKPSHSNGKPKHKLVVLVAFDEVQQDKHEKWEWCVRCGTVVHSYPDAKDEVFMPGVAFRKKDGTLLEKKP